MAESNQMLEQVAKTSRSFEPLCRPVVKFSTGLTPDWQEKREGLRRKGLCALSGEGDGVAEYQA
jgi:hypothetical protein